MTGRHGKPASVTRRSALAGIAALGAAATGPWVVRSEVLAAAGRVNILMWSTALPPGFLKSFTARTGIEVNYVGIDSNEEIIAGMKAVEGRGVDIIGPTSMRAPQWAALDLLQPFDLGRIGNIDNVNPAMREIGDKEWNFGGKGSHWLPHLWGTEGVAWRTDLWTPPRAGAMPSYGDLWGEDVKGRTMMRPHSGMLGAGLYLETTGALEPGAMRRAYDDEKTMRATWRKVTDFCIENKAQLKLFWNGAETQRNGLSSGDVIVGQTWDGPPITMMYDGAPVQYRAPVEGALAWVDGLALSKAAEDLDAVYAFIDYCFEAEPAGKSIDGGSEGAAWGGHGSNSAVLGAEKYASGRYAEVFASAYPGDSRDNLWPWPSEPKWYADLRTEYRDALLAA